MPDIVQTVIAILIAIIGYFLGQTMNDIKEMKKSFIEVERKVSVIENDYLNKHKNLSDRFDELNNAVKDLTKEIQILSKEIMTLLSQKK